MTSLPTYNPNKLVAGNTEARRNAVTYNLYELGSTFKPLSIGAAIDNGVVTSMAKRYDATKPLAIAGFHIRDSHMMNRWLNVPETLIHSSNIRSEEHTSELQSLMRISYAVFCLKKKINYDTDTTTLTLLNNKTTTTK